MDFNGSKGITKLEQALLRQQGAVGDSKLMRLRPVIGHSSRNNNSRNSDNVDVTVQKEKSSSYCPIM